MKTPKNSQDQDKVKAATYYPKQFRIRGMDDWPDSESSQQPPNRFRAKINKQNIWSTLAIWVVISLVMYTVFKQIESRKPVSSQGVPRNIAPNMQGFISPSVPLCASLPGRGIPPTFDSTAMQNRAGVPYGTLTLKNTQTVSVVAVLMDISESRPLQALTVGPGATTQIKVPSGQYGFHIFAGNNWCNLNRGFTDGTRHKITGGVEIKGAENTLTTIGPSSTPGQITIGYRHLRDAEQTQPGVLVVRQSENGYVTPGTVNGVSVSFIVDTGASGLSISSWVAQQAGIRVCDRQTMHSTANGYVAGCESTVAELSFGPFRLTNVKVSILPNLPSGALLGMDVLRRFNMVWRGDMVQISSI